jgi:hypothetical protein
MGVFGALRRIFRGGRGDATVVSSGMPKQPVYDKDKIPAVQAKKSCRHCYGTGYTGTRKDKMGMTVKIACRCVMKKIPKGFKGDVRLIRNT